METPHATDLVTLEHLLRAQWLRLRDWVDERDLGHSGTPSVLAGWTVAELVAHLGKAMTTLTHAQPAEAGAEPMDLAAYVSGYARSAESIAEDTRRLAEEHRDGPLPAVDRMAEQAFAQLGVLRDLGRDPVVQARRGPVRLSTLVVTRLVELVVHGDDLVRSTRTAGTAAGPLEPGAVGVVAEALLGVLVDRGGPALEVVDPLAWVRLACGRVPADAVAVRSALRPQHPADGLPEVAAWLPLL